jgi:creatinine amidohydrolase
MNVFDWQNTTFEIEDAEIDMAILPVAACEQHGQHLPVGTDQLIMDVISRRVAEALATKVFLLPAMPLGTSALHGGTPGTVWLGEETLYQVVYDVVDSLYEHNIRYAIVINNHGGANETTVRPRGNYIVMTAVRQLNYDYPDKSAIWVQPFTVAKEELLRIFESAEEEIHAGEVETSVMLHLAADLVKGRGEDYIPALTKEYLDYVSFEQISSSGIWGRPSLASAEKGAEALDVAIQATIIYIKESFAHLDRMKAMKN